MISVFLVDDHELVRTGIRRIIEDVRGMNVAGEAESGEDAAKWCRSNHADVILMDMNILRYWWLRGNQENLAFQS